MKKTASSKAICFFMLAILLILPGCSSNVIKNYENKTDISTKTPTKGSFYDYELIYTYHNTDCDPEDFANVAELLQSKDNLTVLNTNYKDGNGVLQICFQLKLSEKEPDYTINFTKQMQDAVVLFAVFDFIKGVEINFTQADYTFGGVPITRADAEAIFGEAIAPFGTTKERFMEEFPDKVQAVVWEPGIMDTVNYYHAMGIEK